MAPSDPQKIRAHEPREPYPKLFKLVFLLSLLYLVVLFAVTGSHYVVGAH